MRRKIVCGFIIALTATAAVHGAAREASPLAATLARVAGASNYLETALSPNGRLLAWSVSRPPSEKLLSQGSAIYFTETGAPKTPVRISAASAEAEARPSEEKSLAWSPDSSMLAFLSDAESPGQLELYVMQMSTHSVRRMTQLKGFLATPAFAPDGRSIAILFTENAQRAAGPLEAVPQETGVIGSAVLEQRLATVDLATGAVRLVSPADLYVYEYDWAPDGRSFAATAAHGAGDNNWYIAELYRIDRASGAAASIVKTDMQIAVPRWSKDGRRIGFIGGLMSDESVASGDLYVVDARGGTPQNLTRTSAGSTFWYTWLPKTGRILTAEALDGASGIAEVQDSGSRHLVWAGPETLSASADYARGVSLAADGMTSAVIRESFNEPPSLWVGRTGAWHRLYPRTTPEAPLWGAGENLHWSSDQFTVQGWLVPPTHIEAGVRYPLVVWAHGGPAWLNAPARPKSIDYATLLANQGYYVFLPNPRGSAGFGETFKRANIKDMGGGDLRDILAGVAHVIATHPIDEHRIGITGWSYGGYMALWAITQTNLFSAAVGGAGCSDLLSYYGENGIDEWLIPYFGASVYDDPAIYAKSSPINFIKRVHTPTLLIVGDSDVESPPPQSYEYWHALKTLGVKTELVIYPHEGHEFSDPAHILDRMQRTVSWFDENMPAAQPH